MAEVQLDLEYDLSCVDCEQGHEFVLAMFLVPTHMSSFKQQPVDSSMVFVPLCEECMKAWKFVAEGIPMIRLDVE